MDNGLEKSDLKTPQLIVWDEKSPLLISNDLVILVATKVDCQPGWVDVKFLEGVLKDCDLKIHRSLALVGITRLNSKYMNLSL